MGGGDEETFRYLKHLLKAEIEELRKECGIRNRWGISGERMGKRDCGKGRGRMRPESEHN